MPTTTLSPRHVDVLTHMLGAGSHIKKRNHGFRNHFCAGIGGEDHRTLLEMEKLGLVHAFRRINEDRDELFAATRAGCEAIGLNKAAIKRALGD